MLHNVRHNELRGIMTVLSSISSLHISTLTAGWASTHEGNPTWQLSRNQASRNSTCGRFERLSEPRMCLTTVLQLKMEGSSIPSPFLRRSSGIKLWIWRQTRLRVVQLEYAPAEKFWYVIKSGTIYLGANQPTRTLYHFIVKLGRVAMTFCHWLALASVVALANSGSVQPADLTWLSSAANHQKDGVDLFVTSYEAYKSVSFWVPVGLSGWL